MAMSSGFVAQLEGEGHGCELGIAVPQKLGARRVARAPKPPAEACEQFDRFAQVLRWSEAARAAEGGEHTRLDVGEHHLGGRLRHLAPEPDHQLDTPAHHHLDGDGALEALGAVMLELLDLAAGLEDAEVVLDALAKRVALEDALGIAHTAYGHGGEQEPLQRLGIGRRALLAGVHHPQRDRRVE